MRKMRRGLLHFCKGEIDLQPFADGCYLIAATVLFAVQIYCDFAGYSTIAMGAGSMGCTRSRASLGKEDFAGERAIEERSRVWKGAEPLSGVVERREHKNKKKGEGELPVYDEQSKQYLEKMIDLCDDRAMRRMSSGAPTARRLSPGSTNI